MSFDEQRLYELLPALYRLRDTELGKKMLPSDERGPLKALLSIIAEQVAVLEEDIEQLYDDQFIETCAEWVVPYIGDLLGTRGLVTFPDAPFSQRAQVANTIAYRRRKGTAAVVEQLARDVTAWNASVVEYFQLLATTQYMNHLRPRNLSIASVRQWELLEHLTTPFDKVTRTVDVRRIEKRRGKYNIPNIGIYLWRLDSYPITKSPAFKVDDRRYTFNVLGKDIPLYNKPETEAEITHLAEPINVSMPITRRWLDHYLEMYYGKDKSLLIYIDEKEILPVETSHPMSPPSEKLSDLITICNLSDLHDPGGTIIGWSHMPQHKIAIDPVLGRIAFPTLQSPPTNVHVNYHYGFSAEIGGGEYGRADTFSVDLQPVIKVPSDKTTIQEALNELAVSGGVVEIQDNEYYIETLLIEVPAGKKIELRAAEENRPVLVVGGELLISGGENAEVSLNGLLMSSGSLRLPLKASNNQSNKLRYMQLQHCTLLPGPSPAIRSVAAQPAMPRLFVELPDTTVEINKSIVGGMRIVDGAKVRISNSIVDATNEAEVAYAGLTDAAPGASLHAENSTIIGKVHTVMMEMVSNTIFLATLTASDQWAAAVTTDRLQQGCVRFSYFPPGSKVPRPYHCQPKTLEDAARVRPVFTSVRYGDPGYCQLSQHCAVEIRQGADDEAEMGVFHTLYQPQREANLQERLDEYLRFGLEAGIYYGS